MSAHTGAPFWRRLAALFYDLLVLVAIWMVASALVLLAFQGKVDVAHQPPLYHFVLQSVLLTLSALYFVISWSRGGQTIGMRAWRVRIVDAEGRSPNPRRSLLRFALALVSLIAGFGFIWCLFDADRRAWHDVMAETRMV
ncbi:MAG TPA: RDD family protein [Dokdonella sp.]|uniref:RDD family protein n=1 Tax=Dokdonella sp. TaxID=2291710 RepID=UPI002D805824|nr:RDD family protein [Dokdonella sp.]HET9031939.1 RDD family protein [Dokdonella sp.]